MKCDDDVNYSK